MANTNLDLLYPEFWASAFDSLDIGQYQLQNLVSRNTEPLLSDLGQSVNVPLAYDFGDADDWTPGSTITASDIAQQKVTVTLDTSKRKTFTLNGADLSKSPYDLVSEYGVGAAKSIIQTVNKDIYAELLNGTTFHNAISSFANTDVLEARKLLSANEVSEMNRYLVAGTDDYSDMLGFDDFAQVYASSDNMPIIEGKVNRRYGFDIFENNAITTYTPADLVGAVNDIGGASPGDTTLVVDGFDDDANPIRVGDVFTIADETGTPYHTVTATTTTGSDTTGITFSPAIIDGGANDAVITVVPTRSIVGFVPSALAFAARAYASLPDGVGVRSTIAMFRNLPVRISVWNDGNLGIKVQYDILYGMTVTKESRIVRILR